MSSVLLSGAAADFRHAPIRKFWFDDEAAPARSVAEERLHRQARLAFESLYAGLVTREPELLN
ncbi:hypothetical protein [Paraburkholderia ferrariae]|uniref:hypothetical protein n=1 Tax=Paraburkholderia ferrariae TaxID=386056 RepID=UPI0004839E2D|nr:hypothetical protein [Paraburkholderia ferrariae]